jgi:aminopeptidase N
MLESVIGEEMLRKGLMLYLNEHKFRNARTDDLWTALSYSTNGSIEVKVDYIYKLMYKSWGLALSLVVVVIQAIMDTWTTHMGFPLIRVRLEDRTVKISQERFVMNPVASNETDDSIMDSLLLRRHDPEYLWYIPLSYVTDLQPRNTEFVWLNKTQSCK